MGVECILSGWDTVLTDAKWYVGDEKSVSLDQPAYYKMREDIVLNDIEVCGCRNSEVSMFGGGKTYSLSFSF